MPKEDKPCVRERRINAGGLDGRGIGVIDGWNVRITITDYGQDARLMSPRA